LQVKNLSKQELDYYGDMANYGYYDIDIDGKLKEDKNDVAIDELKNSYKIHQEKKTTT
jgi:hypothetical protein